MTRKYRQRGYMDDGPEKKPKAAREAGTGPPQQQQRKMVAVFKCSRCGNVITDFSISLESVCGKCGNDLRTCVNCKFFDPSARFQCMKTISQNISPKDKRNECSFFTSQQLIESKLVTVETPVSDPRQAFENLFKK